MIDGVHGDVPKGGSATFNGLFHHKVHWGAKARHDHTAADSTGCVMMLDAVAISH